MFAKWKSKLKAAIKEAKDKRNGRNGKHPGSEALAEPVVTIEKQSDGLSRPYGLGGRKSVDLPAAAQAANNAGYPAAAMSGASLGTAAEQQDLQQQHQQAQGDSAALPQQQQQLDTQHASMMAQHHQHHQHMHGHASGLRPLDCADRNTHGVDVLMRSCPGSPVAPGHHPAAAGALQDTPPAGNHHASTAPNGSSSAGGPSTRQIDPSGATASGQTSPEAAGLGLAGDNSELGSTLGGVPTSQHRLDASRTPKDEDLGSCPPYAAKAVWGLRYTMEDKWAAVPNLIQVPLVLTMPAKKSKGSKSGCGCMIPAASKVLAKVSPSSRLGSSSSSAGKDKDKDASRASGLQAPSPGLEKASPDRQRLIGHGLSSSDEQGAAAAHAAAGDGSSGGSLGPLPGMDALHYFGVFDGHGGADAARYCAQRMHQVVCNTIMSMLSPEVAATAVCSALATCRQSNTDLPAEQLLHLHRHQQQQQQQGHHHHQQQQQPGEAAAPLSAGDGAPAATAGGSNAAAAAAAEQQLLPAIDIVTSNGSWVLPALSRSFVTLDHEFGAISEGSYVGSTAVVVLVGGQRLWVAHAGDSRAVLGRAGALQVLTSDHKASRDDEVARVQAAGGHVWWDRVMGELAVSRAIGDHCLRPYVIPEPELLMVERTPDDEVLVMASDGLWDVMNNQEAVDMALHSLQAAQASGHVGVAAVKRSANALTKAALERGTRDNVTVLVVDLRPRKAGTYEAAASSSHHGSRHGSSSSGRGHSSSKSSSKSSSRSSKKGAAAAAPAAAATPLAATGASAAAAAASECVPGVTADSAAGVTQAAAAAAAREAAAASIGGLQTPSAGTSESSLASAAAAAPADAAAVPAAGTGAGTLPAVQPAAAEAEGPAAAGAAQLSRAASGSTGETHSLIQPHESSSHGAGI